MEMTKEVAEKLLEIHRASRGFRLLQAGPLLDLAMVFMESGLISKSNAGVFIIGNNEKWTACQKFGMIF